MPPRIPLLTCLNASSIASHPVPWTRAFTSSTAAQAKSATKKRKSHDPYSLAQARARKAANLSRQEVLNQERASALGDPVRGEETEYVRSFDTLDPQGAASPSPHIATRVSSGRSQPPTGNRAFEQVSPNARNVHNFYVQQDDLDTSLERARRMATPVENSAQREAAEFTSEQTPEQQAAEAAARLDIADEAVRRISSLSLASSKDRLRLNKQRCIADFGRHNTDTFLPPKPTAPRLEGAEPLPVKTPSAGPDTGSSEVQIAILTAKIRTLADFLEARGGQDKVNKRNLRLLVHRRQKLLKYLRRKERGGPRWQHVVETLGLTEGTWQGEISM